MQHQVSHMPLNGADEVEHNDVGSVDIMVSEIFAMQDDFIFGIEPFDGVQFSELQPGSHRLGKSRYFFQK